MNSPSPTGKAAELTSGLGAIVLGAGLALLAPEALRTLALPILAVGVLVHAGGMTLKNRLERRERVLLWWERGLFWLCWACLVVLLIWVPVRLLVRQRAAVQKVRHTKNEL